MNNHNGLGKRRVRKSSSHRIKEEESDIEADEGHEIFDEEPIQPKEDDEGEDIMENMDDDYKDIDKLDNYDYNDLDDENDYSEIDFDQKRRADEVINRRKKQDQAQKKTNRKIPDILKDQTDESLYSDGLDVSGTLIKRRKEEFYENLGEDQDDDDEEDEKYHDLEEIRGKLTSWIQDPKTVRFIKRSFKQFLTKYREDRLGLVYEKRIYEMCSNNKQSLEVTYLHLSQKYPTLAYWIFETPALILPYLNTVAYELACRYFPGFDNIHNEVYVKIADFPLEEKIKDLRVFHLNTLIKVKGVITRRYPVYNSLKKLFVICSKCGDRTGPIFINDGDNDLKLPRCVYCQSLGPYKVDKELTIYRSNQKITVQESPNSVEPGRVPRYKDVMLLGDNIDIARPGDEVEAVGIYTSLFDQGMNAKHGFPIFNTFIEANHIKRTHELKTNEITEKDKEMIMALSKDKKIFEKISNSIAPSIYGHDHVKKAISLALFGGTPVKTETHKVRGDINILMLGDPGLAKSQFLKYIQGVSHRSIYTTGKGATAVGLTASVRRDPIKGEWCLEAGALVLADTGICLIDEFDKMSDQDRTSIHEAMEQQSISISKAGIVANLQARCSVVAAANPKDGTYDNHKSFKENVHLTDPILSRFDVLCVLKDVVRIDKDAELAEFIVGSHMINHPDRELNVITEENKKLSKRYNNDESLSQELLKKYVLFAKKNYNPQLTVSITKKLENFYVRLRQISSTVSGIDIVPRHLESLIRFSQASAKIHLRQQVEATDCDIAISMLLESFIQTQKPSIGKNIEKQFALELKKNRNIESLILHELQEILNNKIALMKIIQKDQIENENESVVKIPLQELEERLKNRSIDIYLKDFIKKEVFTRKYSINNGIIERKIAA